jgi:hypothetical protein
MTDTTLPAPAQSAVQAPSRPGTAVPSHGALLAGLVFAEAAMLVTLAVESMVPTRFSNGWMHAGCRGRAAPTSVSYTQWR